MLLRNAAMASMIQVIVNVVTGCIGPMSQLVVVQEEAGVVVGQEAGEEAAPILGLTKEDEVV